ncbi:Uncharacterised protein [Mycobacterium tuberculosis]|nr:Uncharacterised protein [Mycobacterium tuberculosis]
MECRRLRAKPGASRRISAHFGTTLGAYASARPQKSPALRRNVSTADTSACDSSAPIPTLANTCSLRVTVASSTVERPSSVIYTSVVRPSVGCGTRRTNPSASSRRIAWVTLVT